MSPWRRRLWFVLLGVTLLAVVAVLAAGVSVFFVGRTMSFALEGLAMGLLLVLHGLWIMLAPGSARRLVPYQLASSDGSALRRSRQMLAVGAVLVAIGASELARLL